jgi:hypothetical protein
MSRRGALVGLLVSALLPGSCALRGGWDARSLENQHPQLAAHPKHRLVDAPPYFAPSATGLALFLCRWPTDRAIPVALPADATAAESALLRAALRAWQTAGLGVSFRVSERAPGPLPRRGIEIDFVDDPERGAPVGSGDTVADCAIAAEAGRVAADAQRPSGEPPGALPISAELHYASVYLRRALPDLLGRSQPLSSTELLGAAVHELGHALGFSGHVASGGSVMSAHGQIDSARRWGRRIEAGGSLDAPTLRALYALPSGVRVGWLPLRDAQLEPLRALAGRAESARLRGPFVRVAERSARLFWREPDGASCVLAVPDWSRVLRDPERFAARPNSRARALLRAER